jgi:serine/threonine-protein kinase
MEHNNLVNSTLGKYRIEAEIGRGGMAVVYRGYDPDLDRNVAVKVLAPHLVWDELFVERFLREARAAARVKHPNIVTIHDVGQQAGWYYFVMEYLAGHSLTALIQQRGSFPPQAVLAILRPVASALDYAHHDGLVHRDIKPGNIMVSPRGHVTLTDFGIARAVQDARLTGTGTIVGTPEYMSPEQAKGLTVDARSDQYSLAVVAYEMLSGDVPFKANSTLALMYKLVHEPPPPISQARSDLPAGVQPALGRALAKEPGERYSKVMEFVEVLDRALAGGKIETAAAAAPALAAAAVAEPPTPVMQPAPPPPSGPRSTPAAVARPTPQPQPAADRSRMVIWGLSLTAVVVLIAILGGCWFLVLGGDDGAATPAAPGEMTATTVVIPDGDGTSTAIASPSASPTQTPSATITPTRTATRTTSPTPSRTPTRTPSPTPTNTPTKRPPTSTPIPPTATRVPPTATLPPPPPPTATQAPPPTQPPPTQPPPPPPTQPPAPPPTQPPAPPPTQPPMNTPAPP